MSDASTTPPPKDGSSRRDTKLCKVCAEPIPAAAKKCNHCDSFQNWYANIGFSSSILALIIALISVGTTAIPVVVNAVTPKNSSLMVAFQSADPDSVTLLVSNSGTRTGSVTHAVLYFMDEAKLFELGEDGSRQARLVEPGKSELITFHLKDLAADYPPHSKQELFDELTRVEWCKGAVSSSSFTGEAKSITFVAACPFLAASWTGSVAYQP